MRLKEIYDPDFGQLHIKINAKARNIILYTRADGLHITVPPHVSEIEVRTAIERFRKRLLKDKETVEGKRIDFNFSIDAEFFKLRLIQGTKDKFLANSSLGNMTIVCPPDTVFEDDHLQAWFRKVIGEALRRNAKVILPPRLEYWSRQLNLPFGQLKINSSKGRWGSCSSSKNINLSFYLVLLPQHLIDYVLIHELCHTREMNHSERFWDLMDTHTRGRAQALRRELKQYRLDLVF